MHECYTDELQTLSSLPGLWFFFSEQEQAVLQTTVDRHLNMKGHFSAENNLFSSIVGSCGC